jgi:CubicO group peptidase (beta-lactamase class C family)
MPGYLVMVSRYGRIAHVGIGGRRDVGADLPVRRNTLFRIYSMTKPVTTVAALILFEQGAFGLDDPVSRFVPAFTQPRVYSGPRSTVPATVPIRMRHLLTHTAGLTYGFHRTTPVDALYRDAGFDLGLPAGLDLAEACDTLAGLPLLAEPGAEWNYSLATDVLGRIVEVVSGKPLASFVAEQVFRPLGMADTGFEVPPDRAGRLGALYRAGLVVDNELGSAVLGPVSAPSGGGGLVSTADDFHRFASMLLGRGELDGTRILAPRTVDLMTRNSLPGGVDLAAAGRPLYAETPMHGVGYGFGVGVVLDPGRAGMLTSVGEYGWGGAASTVFWVDPAERIVVVFLTQLMPPPALPIRPVLRQLVMQAVVG